MNYLALDTSAGIKVMLTVGKKNYDFIDDDGKMASQVLLPKIDYLLNRANITLDQLDAIAVVIGPGSFTGIRIAVNTARALSYVKKIPLIAIDSLLVGAYSVKDKVCASVVYGWGKNFYYASYKNRIATIEPKVIEREEIEEIGGVIVCDAKSKRFIKNAVVCEQKNAIRKIIRQRLKREEYTPFEQVLPFYIAVSQAEKDLQK